jgi:hypothetical protein
MICVKRASSSQLKQKPQLVCRTRVMGYRKQSESIANSYAPYETSQFPGRLLCWTIPSDFNVVLPQAWVLSEATL